MAKIIIKVDGDCQTTEEASVLNRKYRTIKIRGIASKTIWKNVLGGRTATIGNRLGHIRNRSTRDEEDICDFIHVNGGAFLEVEV